MSENTAPDLAAIAALSVAQLAERLDGLSAGQLEQLYALESGRDGGPRTTALAAILAELERARGLGDESAGDAMDGINAAAGAAAEIAEDGGSGDSADSGSDAAGAGATPAPSAAAVAADVQVQRINAFAGREESPPEKRPAWQADDYTGPLTGDQAQWRVRHLKPQNLVVTK